MVRITMLSMHTSPLTRLGIGDGGGLNVYVKELAERLAAAGDRVDVYTGTDGTEPDVIDLRSGLRVHNIDMSSQSGAPSAERADYFAEAVAHSVAVNGGSDLLHAHYWMSGVAAHTLKHRLEIPMISTFHTLSLVKTAAGVVELDSERVGAEGAVIGCSDAIVANDNSEAADLIRLYGADADKIHVIPPGVDHKHFTPKSRLSARSLVGLPAARPVILYVGRIQMVKGADIAIEALAQLRRTNPDALLVVVGGPSGPDGQDCIDGMRAAIAREGLQNNVRFVGPQARNTMAHWYSAADVCLVPSRSESFGLVALEASACGTPVVAAAVGGLPNVVTDGHSGYLTSAEDSSAMSIAIARVLGDSSTAAKLGAAGVKRAQSFDWSTTSNRSYCLYNRVLDDAILAGAQPGCVSA